MDPSKPAKAVKDAVEAAAAKVADVLTDHVPGAPSSAAPTVAEPTDPDEPLPPKKEHGTPETRTPTGAETGTPATAHGQQGAFLTTAQGARLRDTDHSLKAGPRGPVLLQDHHLREKITHFDHERIPERVVHARGAGAHGVFTGYGTADAVTRAGFLKSGKETPVFVRFSTVLGSRGSADTVRDTRGFATKFYTDEGTFDLVGNNIPVFFIQDAIKFPDIIHAGKPHPDREIPQAQSAHDTFWDFVSLHTEAQHHTMWNMSDRGIPRSYRTMEGFGVHTFRLVNEAGETVLVKFHWKPKLGVHSLDWEEAQLLSGIDPDFHRRDLYDAIEAGAFPEWELGIQIFPDTPEETFAGIDLLDPTKIVPEELAPVQPVGKLVLNRTPTNFFAETEQVAFHLGHLPPGIDVTNDPLLQGRLFSYVDTQLTRLGRPELRPDPDQPPARAGQRHAARRLPPAGRARGGRAVPAELARRRQPVPGRRRRERLPRRAGDRGRGAQDARQPGVVRRPLQPGAAVLAEHDAGGEGAHRPRLHVRAGQVLRAGDQGTPAAVPGQHRPGALRPGRRPVWDCRRRSRRGPSPRSTPSPALSQIGRTWPSDGRTIGIVVDPDGELDGVGEVRRAVFAAGMVPLLIAPHGGMVGDLPVQRTFATAPLGRVRRPPARRSPRPGPGRAARPGRQGRRRRHVRRGPAGPAPGRRVLAARQGDRRLGRRRHRAGAGRRRRHTRASSPRAPGRTPSPPYSELLGTHRVWQRFPASVG